jgi:hypothetical protein
MAGSLRFLTLGGLAAAAIERNAVGIDKQR